MENYLSKNMRALRKKYPSFRLPEAREASDYQFEYCLGIDGQPNICFQKEGGLGYLHDPADSSSSAKILTNPVTLNGNGLLVSFGLGCGYEVRELLMKMDKGTNFVIVEPSAETLRIILEHTDISDILETPNVHFLLWEGKQTASVFFTPFISSANYKNLATFVISSYVGLFFDRCRDLFFAVDDIRHRFELMDMTIERFTPIWQKNALANLQSNMDSFFVSDFFGTCKDIPAVIVSAGPSLAKNIAQLKQMEDRVLIISVDTALHALLKHEIRPHFVVSLDGQELVWNKFKNLDYSQIPLVYIPVSSAKVVANHHGKKLLSFVQDAFYMEQMLRLEKHPGYLEMGGSVATSAFSLAQRLECNPIILIGQDLAYTGMQSHIEGSAYYKEIRPEQLVEPLLIESSDGGQVYTDSKMFSYLVWFQTYAASDTSGRTYINATEGGANIEGFENRTLAQTLAEYAKKDGLLAHIDSLFANAPALTPKEKKAVVMAYKSAIAFLDGILPEARAASEQLQRIAALLQKPQPNQQAIASAYSRIDPFEKKVVQENEKLQLLSITLAPYIEDMNFQFQNAEFASDIEKSLFAARKYSAYYKILAECIETYLPEARAALTRS